jgi:hypothetical protein
MLMRQAYLALHQGKEAGAEFQRFIYPLASLARLGLARAYTEPHMATLFRSTQMSKS